MRRAADPSRRRSNRPEVSVWQILYPQNSGSSHADDVPAALTIRKASGIIQAWVTGFFSRSSTGDDMEVVHYEEVFP
jgi:hypothetical protein